jgi:predicted esterase
MARTITALLLIAFWSHTAGAQTQDFTPPAPFMPDAATMKAIEEKRGELHAAIERLQRSGAMKVLEGWPLGDQFHWDPMVEVFAKAADWTVRRNEFHQKDSGKQTLAVLEEGLRRARDFPGFLDSLKNVAERTLACGYRSEIDGSIQPYVVSFPLGYGGDANRKWRLDIVLHGRDNTLTEVKMLAGALRRGKTKPDQDFIQLEVFGRGNNAYRWAGETDIFEAENAFIDLEHRLGTKSKDGRIDRERVVLRGFSMGGAGAWHLGLHYPTNWCVIGPGAGFTTTRGYIKNLPTHLPSYQEACLHIYDAVDYAENAAMVPVVAYGGDKDPQQQAALNIEAKLKPLGIPMTRLVGLGLAHQFPPEWQTKAQEAYAPFVERGRSHNSKRIHFVTYTLSYPTCDWITLLDLEQHYARTSVDATVTADGYDLETKNVRAFSLGIQPALAGKAKVVVRIDGQKLELEPSKSKNDGNSFSKQQGVWKDGFEPSTQFILTPGSKPGSDFDFGTNRSKKDLLSHGPIDDAFKQEFICVTGSGRCANPAIQAYTDAALERFRREWAIGFRGDLPTMADKEYLANFAKSIQGIAQPEKSGSLISASLILFGDPSSNAVIAKIMELGPEQLPLKWNDKEIAFGGKVYPAKSHVPAFIYPNPFRFRYIVINSGHTFHEADLLGTNALLYPRLGDFAILKPTPTAKDPTAAEVVRAGLFDENWKVPAESVPGQK